MVRFLVLYPEPDDIDAFERHYTEVHVPLAKQLPGLRHYRIGRGAKAVRGEESFYLVAELEWDDMESLQRDFGSDLGRRTAADVDELARLCPGVKSVIYTLEDL